MFFGNSMDHISHEHFLATVDFELSYLVRPRTKVLIEIAESKSGFRLQLLYYARSVAKHCDWNQAPGC